MKSQQATADRQKKDAVAAKTKADESQKESQKEISHLKEIIETLKRESSNSGQLDQFRKLQVRVWDRKIREVKVWLLGIDARVRLQKT